MTKQFGTYKRCYHDHPPYEIAPGLTIYGGSGNTPAVLDAEVYIGFDHGMDKSIPFPWEAVTPPVKVFFPITDMSVPQNLDQFKNLIVWTAEQLHAGKKVHAGCIGGHGRTGLFFSALRKYLTGDEDATTHVRANYCKKVVESRQQVDWLHQHFGIKKVPATKGSYGHGTVTTGGSHSAPKMWQPKESSGGNRRTTGAPKNLAASIWGA